MTARREYRLISADSHVNEPPDLWTERVPAAMRDRAPRIEHFDEGDECVRDGCISINRERMKPDGGVSLLLGRPSVGFRRKQRAGV